METREKLLVLMQNLGVDQEGIAKLIGISQPTVSRILGKGRKGQCKSQRRIDEFIQKNAYKMHKKELPDELCSAINGVWDKTPAHARILAKIIRSLSGLVPSPIVVDERSARGD